MTDSVLPYFLLSGDLTFESFDVLWEYNDGTGTNSDLHVPNTDRIVVSIDIGTVSHSSHLIRSALAGSPVFNGLDIRTNMWIANTQSARAMRIVDILYMSETNVRVVLEDTGRYNTMQDRGGTGQSIIPNGNCFIFEVDEFVNVANLTPAETPGNLLVPNTISSIISRFEIQKEKYGDWKRQINHGLVRGDLLRLAKEDEVQPTSAIGLNTTPFVNSNDSFRINEELITFDSSYSTSLDIVNFLNSQNLDNGNVIASVDVSGSVRLDAADGRDIWIRDLAGFNSISSGLGIQSSGNGVYAGKLLKLDSNSQTPVGLVGKEGPDPDHFYYKLFGEVVEVDDPVPGFIGETLYKTDDNLFSPNPYTTSMGSYVKLNNPKSTVVVTSDSGSTPVPPAFAINKVLITPATNTPADFVNSINTAFPGGEVVATLGTSGEVIIEVTTGEKFTLWDASNNVMDGYGFKSAYYNNGNEKTVLLTLQQPSVPLQRIDLPTEISTSSPTEPSDGDDINVTINGNNYNITLNDQGSGSPLTVGVNEIASQLNSNRELVYEGFNALVSGTDIIFRNLRGGSLELSDGSSGTSVTDLFGTSPVTGILQGGHGTFFDAFNNTGSDFDRYTVVKRDNYSSHNELVVTPVNNDNDIPVGIVIDNFPDNTKGKILNYGIVRTDLNTTLATLGDRVYFDSGTSKLTLTPNTIPVGYVFELTQNSQVYIDIGEVSGGDELVWYNIDATSIFGSTQQTSLPSDAGELVYVHVNGLGNINWTFDTVTKLFTHDSVNAGYSIQTGDELTFVYKKA